MDMVLSESPEALLIAGLFAFISLIISLYQIIRHLQYYMEPVYQRYIVRIIFMVPVYAIASFLSLASNDNHLYFDTIRDIYEAWILYNFLSLCLAYVGGPGAVVVKCEGKYIRRSCIWCTCCLPPTPINGLFLRRCKQGVIQFVLIKPILAFMTLLLYNVYNSEGERMYQEGVWDTSQGYLWIQILYNICYTIALYVLVIFYQATEELLAPFKPVLKFILVKAVIFLTYWQGLLISILASWKYIETPEAAEDLQNFLICIEMFFSAILLLFAFPYKEYQITGEHGHLGTDNVRHAFSIRDVVSDTVHQFAPQYQNYVLYSDGTATGKQPKRISGRQRTFVKMGEETTRYKDNSDLLTNAETKPVPIAARGDQNIELGTYKEDKNAEDNPGLKDGNNATSDQNNNNNSKSDN